MKKLIIFLMLFTFTNAIADVELMVKGKEYWKMNEDTSEWTDDDFKSFWKQKHKGEIISILPSGTSFGRMDVPPAIVHVTVTGITLEEAKLYLEPLAEGIADTTIIKERRYHFTRNFMDSAIALWDADSSHLIITKTQLQQVLNPFGSSNIKQKIIDRLKQ